MNGRSESPLDSTADPLIAVEDVTVAYGDLDVLEGVSLSIERGEFVGLVGPNGAGKTTLLSAINGVANPDSGTVRVDGLPVAESPARAVSRRVATVPQDTTLAFDFSVEDVVAMGRTPYHDRLSADPDADGAVERALERTETAEFRDRSIRSLSGGERQRAVLARAFAQETPALVLDEPTASLDINHQVRTLDLVRDRVDTEGTAVLAAIHDLDLAARFCDRIAVLSDGDLLAVGSPDAVLTGDRLETAFDTATAVRSDPITGAPTVTPLSDRGETDLRVHVTGSGRTAARSIATLRRAGATVTAGVLPAGDVAAATAADLGVETVTAPPFEPVDDRTLAAIEADVAAADAVVVAGRVAPAVREVVGDGRPVVAVRSERDPERAVPGVGDIPADDGSAVGRDRGQSVAETATPLAVRETVTPPTVVDAVVEAAEQAVVADD